MTDDLQADIAQCADPFTDELDSAHLEAIGDNLALAKTKAARPVDAITGQSLKKKDAVRLDDLRPALVDYIRAHHPDINGDDYISRKLLDDYRGRYIAGLLSEERGELSNLETEVVESLKTHDTLTENIEEDYEDHRSFGDRVADIVATFGGSWTFILSFCFFLAVWMGVNIWLGLKGAFDPYPFILLNLILSTIAALQAPVIMMSQRRQEEKDRLRALNDYKVNLKAELEIRHLHEKVDHLLNRQWERLTEIQQIQIEMMLEQAKTPGKVVKVRKVIKRKARKKPAAKTAAQVEEPTPPDEA
ncbi:MAG: DUF1003 domain-containing protein [Asticcacaulis sp.]|uniref:DUF1003 domain-containing protein n=1 Tax=Asticcacaulis sp. TaxID=1872648 RepID=UPI003F7C5E8A